MPAPHTQSQEPVRFSCWSSDLAWNGPNLLKECELIQWIWQFFWYLLDLSWYKNCVLRFGIFLFLFLFFVNGPSSRRVFVVFMPIFNFAALISPLQLLHVLCPPSLSFEIAWSALYWLVFSVAPQIEHMFDLGSTRSTPLKYGVPVATWDRLHV